MVAATKELLLDKIRIDGGTQPRASLNLDAVAEYADAILAGTELPPAVVYFDGSENWLADGFHRFHANAKAERTKMLCEVRKGTLRDAILHAVKANGAHGLRRTNADKRHAVAMLLADREWAAKSDRWIADQCGVHHDLVYRIRPKDQVGENATCRTGKDGKQQPAGNGRKPKPSKAAEAKANHASRAVDFGMTPAAAAKAFDVDEEELEQSGAAGSGAVSSDAPHVSRQPAAPEPNEIGEGVDRIDDFFNDLFTGKPAHVRAFWVNHIRERLEDL